MKTNEKWLDGRSPFGLPKTRIAKQTAGRKKKKEKKEEEGAEAGKAGAPAAKAGAPAAKAAPAKGKK